MNPFLLPDLYLMTFLACIYFLTLRMKFCINFMPLCRFLKYIFSYSFHLWSGLQRIWSVFFCLLTISAVINTSFRISFFFFFVWLVRDRMLIYLCVVCNIIYVTFNWYSTKQQVVEIMMPSPHHCLILLLGLPKQSIEMFWLGRAKLLHLHVYATNAQRLYWHEKDKQNGSMYN